MSLLDKPNALLERIIFAARSGDSEDLRCASEELAAHLDQGGYSPSDPFMDEPGTVMNAAKLTRAAEVLRELGGEDMYDLADACEDAAGEHPHVKLEYLRGELRAERISWGELAELQSLAAFIAPDDVELLEAAAVPEHDAGASTFVAIESMNDGELTHLVGPFPTDGKDAEAWRADFLARYEYDAELVYFLFSTAPDDPSIAETFE